MQARAVLAVAVGALLLAILAVGTPAAARAMITKAHISGPGLGGGGLRISRFGHGGDVGLRHRCGRGPG